MKKLFVSRFGLAVFYIPWLILTISSAARADAPQSIGCNSPEVTQGLIGVAGGASIVGDSAYGLQRKNWTPLGDKIQFSINSFSGIPEDATILACLRWKTKPVTAGDFIETRPSQLALSSDRKLLNVTIEVPEDLGKQPRNIETLALLPLVPFVEVHILIIDQSNKLLANVPTEIGITYPLVALVFAFVAALLGLTILYFVKRPEAVGIRKASWILQVIASKDGFASLSQLQVLLWTFVVAISAIYVMALSGNLVEITGGTLILLGIAGATGVGAAIHNGAQINGAQTAANDAIAAHVEAQNVAAQVAVAARNVTDESEAARLTQQSQAAESEATKKKAEAERLAKIADRLKNPPLDQVPKWSDLLVNQTVIAQGVVTREIDVTRFQMLLFTLITALFVFITVATTYVIPDIPSGFVTLMGISNGVYLGSKITQS